MRTLARLHRLRNTQLAVDEGAESGGMHAENSGTPRTYAIVNRHQPPVADEQFPLAAAGTIDLNAQAGKRRPSLEHLDPTTEHSPHVAVNVEIRLVLDTTDAAEVRVDCKAGKLPHHFVIQLRTRQMRRSHNVLAISNLGSSRQ